MAADNSVLEPDEHLEEVETELAWAVLFPWFTQWLGIFVFFILTRKLHGLPYTAVMFLLGIFMGVGATRSGPENQLSASIIQWTGIDSEVIFLVFLPGLLFRDALNVNFHLFVQSFWQIFIMAFPMVLAGTYLTALVAFYIFPFNWSWNHALTLGSILAATDPVAVASLLNEVGASPRLKIHISGESMFNDGSAVVFFTIFSGAFLRELGPDIGEEYDISSGIEVFVRMALGGVAIGICFAIVLMILLSQLNRRLDSEENVLQVTATITIAYLAFYTSETALHPMSGVLSVVICGITTRAFSGGMINDSKLMESFWVMLEHLLNTLLFTLGGTVWGAIISRNDLEYKWEGRDWGYLFVLYIMVVAIRFLLLFVFFPINSRIGLKTNLRETFFSGWAGLRGAIGITLAISLDNEIKNYNEEHRELTFKLFGMVGGVTFLTLFINGPTGGPILKKLGLAKSTDARKRYVDAIESSFKSHILNDFVILLTDHRFHNIHFGLVKHHIQHLRDISFQDIELAVESNRIDVPTSKYRKPNLTCLQPYFSSDLEAQKYTFSSSTNVTSEISEEMDDEQDLKNTHNDRIDSSVNIEMRMVFIELLRAAYLDQVRRGELDARRNNGFLYYVLLQSLEFASEEVANGKPLNDWSSTQMIHRDLFSSGPVSFIMAPKRFWKESRIDRKDKIAHSRPSLDVYRAMAFIAAHRHAQESFKSEFISSDGTISDAEQLVIRESQRQVNLAEQALESIEESIVSSAVSRLFCVILLNKFARYIESIHSSGLLSEIETRKFLEEIDESIIEVLDCSKHRRLTEAEVVEEKESLAVKDLLLSIKTSSISRKNLFERK